MKLKIGYDVMQSNMNDAPTLNYNVIIQLVVINAYNVK